MKYNSKRNFIRSLALLMCVVAFVIFSACSSSKDGRNQEIKLKDYVIAIPVYDAAKIPGKRSYMILVDAQGHDKTLPIATMFYNQPVWTNAGLQFIDDDSNYFISSKDEKIKIVNHQKTDFQYGSTQYDDNTIVSVLNRGVSHKEDGIIAISQSDGKYEEFSYSTDNAHTGNNIVTCDDNTYAIDLTRDLEDSQLVISKIYDGKTAQYTMLDTVQPHIKNFDSDLQQLFDSSPKVTNEANAGTAFCVAGKVGTFVTVSASLTQDRISSIMLFLWDPRTKIEEFIPVRNMSEPRQYLTTTQATEWSSFSVDEQSVEDNEVLLMSGVTGKIIAVNTQTGTWKLFSDSIIKHNDKFETDFYGRLVLRATQKYVYACALNEEDSAGDTLFIAVYDRKTRKRIHTVHLSKDVNQKVYNTSFKFGYPAVNPTYIWQ